MESLWFSFIINNVSKYWHDLLDYLQKKKKKTERAEISQVVMIVDRRRLTIFYFTTEFIYLFLLGRLHIKLLEISI